MPLFNSLLLLPHLSECVDVSVYTLFTLTHSPDTKVHWVSCALPARVCMVKCNEKKNEPTRTGTFFYSSRIIAHDLSTIITWKPKYFLVYSVFGSSLPLSTLHRRPPLFLLSPSLFIFPISFSLSSHTVWGSKIKTLYHSYSIVYTERYSQHFDLITWDQSHKPHRSQQIRLVTHTQSCIHLLFIQFALKAMQGSAIQIQPIAQ